MTEIPPRITRFVGHARRPALLTYVTKHWVRKLVVRTTIASCDTRVDRWLDIKGSHQSQSCQAIFNASCEPDGLGAAAETERLRVTPG